MFGFGKKKELIGLDIGSHAVKICELGEDRGGYHLKNIGMAMLPPEAISEGVIKEPTTIAESIKALIKNLKIKERNVAISISGFSVIIKKIEMPTMPEKELDDVIQSEASKYIPYNVDEVNLSYEALGPAPTRPRNSEILLVAAKKDIIDEYSKLLGMAGLEPQVIDVDFFALGNAYEINFRQTALISLVDILYVYQNKQEKAISYLKAYIKKNGCKLKVCNKLLSFYREQQNLDGIIDILKLQYKTIKNKYYSSEILKLLINALEQKDVKLAIKFLEKTKVDNTRLLLLYQRAGYYKKALNMVRKDYRKTKNKQLLGQIAILEFEMAKDKKAIMKHVIANFELALKASNNPSYKNYYGYLLIDYNINVKKGLRLVNEALKDLPKNYAFMDSSAWGYYKLKQCSRAYTIMKKVVDQIGLDNEEIKLHWEKIQECKK